MVGIALTTERERGRLGGLMRAAMPDIDAHAAAMRQVFDRRFAADLPPGLSDAEREAVVQARRRVYFAKLAYLSIKARPARAKKSSVQAGNPDAARGGDEDGVARKG